MGNIYNRRSGGDCVGRVDSGKIYNRRSGGDCVGRVEGAHPNSGGAALLLLLN